MSTAKECRSTVIPVLRYKDAMAAIEWLCNVLGFERRLIVPGAGSTVLHAQLTFGNGMVMLGSFREGESEASPDAGALDMGSCLIVNNADEVYEAAKAAGATITYEISDQQYGGRMFSCLDPERHSWHVGTYDPWNEQPNG